MEKISSDHSHNKKFADRYSSLSLTTHINIQLCYTSVETRKWGRLKTTRHTALPTERERERERERACFCKNAVEI